MFVTVIPTGEGKDRPSLSPIPVAYVCVFCICIYVDKNFVINKQHSPVCVGPSRKPRRQVFSRPGLNICDH